LKISRIIENKWLTWIFGLTCLLIFINTLLNQFWGMGLNFIVEPFKDENALFNFIKNKEGILTTISAIFIGIFFTIYTILGTVRLESSFALIDKDSFDKIRRFLKSAFIGSFSFLFIILFLPMFNLNLITPFIYQTIFFFLIYMLLSAFRLCFVLFFIFEHDFSTMHSKLAKEEEEKRKNNEILFRMSDFLDDYQSKHDEEQATYMKQLIQEDLKKKNSNI
jgi:hypothetical protein